MQLLFAVLSVSLSGEISGKKGLYICAHALVARASHLCIPASWSSMNNCSSSMCKTLAICTRKLPARRNGSADFGSSNTNQLKLLHQSPKVVLTAVLIILNLLDELEELRAYRSNWRVALA